MKKPITNTEKSTEKYTEKSILNGFIFQLFLSNRKMYIFFIA